MKKIALALLVALLSACTTTVPPIDRSLTARGQSPRVKFIVIHYTVSDLPRSIKTLTQEVVSSHYLLIAMECCLMMGSGCLIQITKAIATCILKTAPDGYGHSLAMTHKLTTPTSPMILLDTSFFFAPIGLEITVYIATTISTKI